MAGINFIGSYSGIDQSMIDKLMAAERRPLVLLSDKKTTITEKQNAWRDINTRLNFLFDKIKILQNPDTFTSKTAISSNDKIVTMSASQKAVEGIYKIHVEQLATSTSIIGDKELSTTLEAGSFTIENADGESKEITIDAGESLSSLVAKINTAAKDSKDADGKTIKGTGITATVIAGKLVLTDTETGERNITLIDDGNGTLSKLGLNVEEKTGQEAIFTVNGVKVNTDSNKVSDVIDGVTINLHKTHGTGEEDTITVSLDTENLTKAVQDFVDQYNSTMKFIETKLAAGDPEVPGSAGTLAGDSTLMRLHSSLRQMVTSSLSNENTTIKDISQLGVATKDRYGELKFDSAKFIKALSDDAESVINFFYSKATIAGEQKEIGFVSRINPYIDSFISTKEGIIKTKTEGLDRTLKDINNQIEVFNKRMERKEAHYIKMFTALDVAMMRAEDQMNWLQGQIDAMNGIKKK